MLLFLLFVIGFVVCCFILGMALGLVAMIIKMFIGNPKNNFRR